MEKPKIESYRDKAQTLVDLLADLQEVHEKTSPVTQNVVLTSKQILQIRNALFVLQDCENNTKAFSRFEGASAEDQVAAAQALWKAVYVQLDENRREQIRTGEKLIQWLKSQQRPRPAPSAAIAA